MKLSQLPGLALMLGALVVFSSSTRAQDNNNAKPDRPAAGQRERRGGAGGGAGPGQIDRISERLKLTDDQKTKLQPILREEAAKLRELRQDNSLSREQMRDKTREVRDQYLAKIKPILSQEQFDQFKKMREEGPGRGQRGARQGRDARTPAEPEKKQ